jgi:hypothetical protein
MRKQNCKAPNGRAVADPDQRCAVIAVRIATKQPLALVVADSSRFACQAFVGPFNRLCRSSGIKGVVVLNADPIRTATET